MGSSISLDTYGTLDNVEISVIEISNTINIVEPNIKSNHNLRKSLDEFLNSSPKMISFLEIKHGKYCNVKCNNDDNVKLLLNRCNDSAILYLSKEQEKLFNTLVNEHEHIVNNSVNIVFDY